jgi:hypothetical protein
MNKRSWTILVLSAVVLCLCYVVSRPDPGTYRITLHNCTEIRSGYVGDRPALTLLCDEGTFKQRERKQ